MTKVPQISIVMPAYNAGRYIGEAIQSILEQTFQDFEVIVIDDGSTDDTQSVMASITDHRVRHIRHTRNRGLATVLNEGLDLAAAPIIARMDADDRMYPDRLARQLDVLTSDPSITAVAAFADLMNEDGEITGTWDTDRACVSEEEIRNEMPRTNCIVHSTVMFRKALLKGLRYAGSHEDWDLWLRLLSRGSRMVKIAEPLLALRVHRSSYMGGLKKKEATELRLIRSRNGFLRREWAELHFKPYHLRVMYAQLRSAARHIRLNLLPGALRKAKRSITYSPLALVREQQALEKALDEWKGSEVLLFPHMRIGGAELVHARIANTIADRGPLIIIHGFSDDEALRPKFEEAGTVITLPRLLNHPLRRNMALEKIAHKLNSIPNASLFGSLSGVFFDLLPYLGTHVRTTYLQHAFLHQPDANLQHKAWLEHYPRVDHYVFIARQAKQEFEKFLFTHNIPSSTFHKLQFISNCVEHFHPPQEHERIGLLFVGRDSAEKRAGLFLGIAQELNSRIPDRFRTTMVGPSLQRAEGPVRTLGMIADPIQLKRIYSEHDIIVVTSSREGFPMVIMEAMAMGLAVMSTPVGDVPIRLSAQEAVIASAIDAEVVQHEMVDALLALDNDRERLRQMRRASHQLALQEFGPDRFQRAYRELLISPASSA